MKVLGIGGDMASGKSYLVRQLLGPTRKRGAFKNIVFEYNPARRLFAIGKYDKSRYPGTDFMYHPQLESNVFDFLLWVEATHPDSLVVFEGDRVYKDVVIERIRPRFDCTFIMLTVTEETCFLRHMKRQDNQQMKQIRLKERRNQNMLKRHPFITPMANNTPDDYKTIVQFILGMHHA